MNVMLKFDFKTYIEDLESEKVEYKEKLDNIKSVLEKKEDMLDWYDVETCISEDELKKLKRVAKKVRDDAQVLVVVGIGGSYLGAKAVIDIFSSYFKKNKVEVVYAGFNLSSTYTSELLDYLKDKNVYVNVVSKSGTTLEPSIAFDLILKLMNKKYSREELKERIIVTTDKEKGELKKLADKEGYTTFTVPDKIGGRYSVLSAVGLLPIEVAGISVSKLLKGAKKGKNYLNEAFEYAVIRDILYRKGRVIESYTVYEPKLYYFSEWLKQLFGETQGKNNLGIFPVSLVNSRDLHSLGQFLQEGNPVIFESVIVVEDNIKVKLDKYKQDLNNINLVASDRVAKAHFNGHTPSLMFKMDKLNEENVGSLIYFFEVAAAVGGYLLDVNPFDQPGVSEYKELLHSALEVK